MAHFGVTALPMDERSETNKLKQHSLRLGTTQRDIARCLIFCVQSSFVIFEGSTQLKLNTITLDQIDQNHYLRAENCKLQAANCKLTDDIRLDINGSVFHHFHHAQTNNSSNQN